MKIRYSSTFIYFVQQVEEVWVWVRLDAAAAIWALWSIAGTAHYLPVTHVHKDCRYCHQTDSLDQPGLASTFCEAYTSPWAPWEKLGWFLYSSATYISAAVIDKTTTLLCAHKRVCILLYECRDGDEDSWQDMQWSRSDIGGAVQNVSCRCEETIRVTRKERHEKSGGLMNRLAIGEAASTSLLASIDMDFFSSLSLLRCMNWEASQDLAHIFSRILTGMLQDLRWLILHNEFGASHCWN